MLIFYIPTLIFLMMMHCIAMQASHSHKKVLDKKTAYELIINHNSSAVTYDLAPGRLGDQLIGYLHAKWISFAYGLPLLYKPFIYSEQLVLHDEEIPYAQKLIKPGMHQKKLASGGNINSFIQHNEPNILYTIPYFPESVEEFQPTQCPVHPWKRDQNCFPYFAVDWKDPVFKELIQKAIKPKYHLNLIYPPQDKISIAVHVRKNSNGADLPFLHGLHPRNFNPKKLYVDVVFPLKHPPEEYYIEQVKKIMDMFPNEQLYVYVFTDDEKPLVILNNMKNAIARNSRQRVEFSCRTTKNNHYTNVLEDLFSMLNFDCLIRADANLSIVASRIGNFKVIISPRHYKWNGFYLTIDQVNIQRQ